LPLKDGVVLLSARLHSADAEGIWLRYPPDRAVYVKEDDLPESIQEVAMARIREARARVEKGWPAVPPRREWDSITTKQGEVLQNVKMVGVKEAGIVVQAGSSGAVVYIDGSDMPAWLVPDVIYWVQEEQKRSKAVKEAVANGTYKGMDAKLWGDGSGRLTVKGRTVQVLELLEESPVEIKVKLSGGVARFALADLEPGDQAAFGFEPALVARWPALSEVEKAREQAAWFERRRPKHEAAKR
jgi:hypothetical protein